MKKKNHYTHKLKAEIVIKILKEEKTMAQIASDHGIHPNQLTKWKGQFLKDAPLIFESKHKPLNELKMKHEKELDSLYEEIGRLSTELKWLKKKSGIELE